MQLQTILLALLGCLSTQAASSCSKGYSICTPPGATSISTPQINTPEFPNLYTNILDSSLPRLKLKRSEPSAGTASLCCNALLSCLLMANVNIPFCYDKFTTNFFLPDGSYGTLVGGAYKSSKGDTANLTSGEYVLVNGEKGNIYSTGTPTATLPLPSQFTGTGIGSAIPASSLGREITITYTTTIPGITKAAVTISPSTTVSVAQKTILYPVTVSGSMIATTSISTFTVPVTVPGTTVSGKTVAGELTTITTTIDAAAASSTSGTKQNQARRMAPLIVKGWMFLIPGLFFVR
ncbi:hypothetical protein VTL71DRAFT_8856 [Oculimacula yallundae]|uniref:Uncharacterized protein n=1 Tax=Oculimacula yallundae TaxID=86028 RepID=A0ABR4BT41_9HELO